LGGRDPSHAGKAGNRMTLEVAMFVSLALQRFCEPVATA
jgi:hypothetical protein